LSLAYAPLENAIYVAGSKDDSLSIIKINAADEIEWIRNFDIVKQKGDHAHKIIVDSEGMIVIAGTAGQFNVLGEVFALRYNPFLDEIIWARKYLSYVNCFNHGLEELTPGSDFTMSNNPSVPGNNDQQFLMLDRQTGDIIPESSFHVDLGDSDALNDLILHEGFLYGNGRYTDGPDFRDMRSTTTKIDPATGESIWTLLGHVPGSASARLYGAGMIIDQGEIFSISVGDENGTSIDNTDIWIQKTSLDGEVEWMNKYDLPGTSDWIDEIISSDGGFVALARTRTAPGFLYLFKIDRDGNLLWAKSFNLAQKNYAFILGGIQGPLGQIGDHLYFTAFSEQGTDEDMVLVKTDLNGNVSDSCGFVSDAEIIVTPVVNPFFYFVEPELFDYNPEVTSESSHSVQSSMLPVKDVCIIPGFVESEILKSICTGEQYAGYTKTGTYIDTFATSSDCDSIRTLRLTVTECSELIHYNLNACTAFMSDGSNMDYSEFTPTYSNSSPCAEISASVVFRNPPQENKHSCTPGLNGTEAMCISAIPGCEYQAGDDASLVIEISVDPGDDSVFHWTGLEFYEKGPMLYNWISGPSGINNYPTLYGIRILKNGTEIYTETDIPTSLNWAKQTYDFLDNGLFRISEPTTFRIELLPYCPIGNGAEVSAWDIEDISIQGGCLLPEEGKPIISGIVHTAFGQVYSGPQIALALNQEFHNASLSNISLTGAFEFNQLQANRPYFLSGFNNTDADNGISTLDLITIQKHLLGIEALSSPYAQIAADVDRNGKINVLDLLIIKKLLLGMYDHFPSNTSWRFGFLLPGEILSDVQQFNEIFTIEALEADTTKVDVTAVKVGDVTGDALSILAHNPVVTRSKLNLAVTYQNQFLTQGIPVEIPIMVSQPGKMEGCQLALSFDGGSILEIVPNGKLPLSKEDYHLNQEGILSLSWHNVYPLSLSEGDILFTIKILPSQDGSLEHLFQLDPTALTSEAYLADYSTPAELTFLSSNQKMESRPVLRTAVSPNPVQEKVTVSCDLGADDQVVLRFINLNGKVIYEHRGWYPAGQHQFGFNRHEFGTADGVLYAQIMTSTFVDVHKLILADH
jgi:hypothetical protein